MPYFKHIKGDNFLLGPAERAEACAIFSFISWPVQSMHTVTTW